MPTLTDSTGHAARLPRAASYDEPILIPFATDLGWATLAASTAEVVGVVVGDRSRSESLARQRRYLAEYHAAAHRGAATSRVPDIFAGDSLATDVLEVEQAPPWLAAIVARLVAHTLGAEVDFGDVPIAVNHLTPFGCRIVRACRRIPRGETRTYGQLAADAGAPGAARAVGHAMAKNRYPLIVPCHRVLAAGGRIGGFSAPQGLTMKRQLLALESVMLF